MCVCVSACIHVCMCARVSEYVCVPFVHVVQTSSLSLTHQKSPSSSTLIPSLFLSDSGTRCHSGDLASKVKVHSEVKVQLLKALYVCTAQTSLPIAPSTVPLLLPPGVPQLHHQQLLFVEHGTQTRVQGNLAGGRDASIENTGHT